MNHIQIYDNILSKEECNKIIEYFDNSPRKERAVVRGQGKRIALPEFKNGSNVTVRLSNCDKTMHDYLNGYILPALDKGIDRYCEKYPFIDQGLDAWKMEDGFNIQKFDGKEEGYFAQHCEAGGSGVSQRILVWMIYLNNAKSGTRFYYPTRDIKARQGRLVLWPAAWTHPHSGITPNKGEKYLMTGWYSFVF